MKKLKTNDLTPALLKEVMKLSSPQEVVEFFKAKDFEVSEKAAQKILDHLNSESCQLDDAELDKVNGGCFGRSSRS